MTALHRMRYVLLLGLCLCLAPRSVAAVPVRTMVAHAASLGLRYTSARYGYSLLIPFGWVHVPNVHWTFGAAAADLTVMSPDHQAALGVLVTPTGNTTYSATDLQNVAERLINQEAPLPGVALLLGEKPVSTLVVKQQVFNHVTFQVVGAYLTYGGHWVCSAQIEVAVTQLSHRLYIVVGLVYRAVFGLTPAGILPPTATATPEGGAIVAPGRAIPAAVATAVPGGLVHGFAVRTSTGRAATAPVPLPTDRLRGNRCPSLDDAGATFLDKNCAGAFEVNLMAQDVASIRIVRQAPDQRPAPQVGPDGFATYVDPTGSALLHYPASWTPVQVSGAVAELEAPDRDAYIALFEQQATGSLPSSALVSIAQQQILQVGRPLAFPTYQSITLDGTPALLALAHSVSFSVGGTAGLAQVSLVVAVMHQHLFVVRATTLEISNTISIARVTYPYFTPFTTLARSVVFASDPQTTIAFSIGQDLGTGYLTVISLAPR